MSRTATVVIASIVTATLLSALHARSSQAAEPSTAVCSPIVSKFKTAPYEVAQVFMNDQLAAGRSQFTIVTQGAGSYICAW